MCARKTIRQYRYLLGRAIEWFKAQEIFTPEEITNQAIRFFFADLYSKGCSDSYVHSYARALKTFFRFMVEEGYL